MCNDNNRNAHNGRTVISYGVAAVLSGIYVMKRQPELDIKKNDLKPNLRISWEQLKLGIPVSLQFTITSIGSMILQSAINSFGSTAVAQHKDLQKSE